MNGSADSIAPLHEMRATFASAAQMQDAVSKLSRSGFDRADLSLPSPELGQGNETPEAGTKPASTEADARQSRTLGASTVGAAAALQIKRFLFEQIGVGKLDHFDTCSAELAPFVSGRFKSTALDAGVHGDG